MSATVTAKGQITIPKAVRDQLGVKPGSKVDFRHNETGEIVLVKTGAKPKSKFERFVGHAGSGMTTDEVMQLLRGDD